MRMPFQRGFKEKQHEATQGSNAYDRAVAVRHSFIGAAVWRAEPTHLGDRFTHFYCALIIIEFQGRLEL